MVAKTARRTASDSPAGRWRRPRWRRRGHARLRTAPRRSCRARSKAAAISRSMKPATSRASGSSEEEADHRCAPGAVRISLAASGSAGSGVLGSGRGQDLSHQLDDVLGAGGPQAFLAAEVVGDRGDVGSGSGGDLADAGRLETLLGEAAHRGLEDRLAGRCADLVSESLDRLSIKRLITSCGSMASGAYRRPRKESPQHTGRTDRIPVAPGAAVLAECRPQGGTP